MWIRDKDANGLHAYTVYDVNNEVFARGEGFTCHMACERAAEIQQRLCLFGAPSTSDIAPASLDDIGDNELLAMLNE